MSTPEQEVSLGPVPFKEALLAWTKIGLLSFGGPAAHIATMHKELVERRKWIDDARFLHALNYCMLLPGPEATQLATYIGWLMHKTPGGIAAGVLFVLPGFVSILLLSILYATLKEVPAVSAMFFGLKAAVLAVVVEAVIRIGKRALKTRFSVGIAALAFIAIFFFSAPFPAIVVSAGALGFLARSLVPFVFPDPRVDTAGPAAATVIDAMAARGELGHTRPSVQRATRTLLACLLLWAGPPALAYATFGSGSVFVDIAAFFSKTAVVTFGGAYSVLAYIAQQAVETHRWLAPGEMLDGLGLAETTPGPLIMVVQFVGFLAAFRAPGELSPMSAGVLGSVMTVWVTFVPCFLWIFLGAPYVEALRGNRAIHAALSTITAAVVGVVLNLSIWFALHVLFRQVADVHLGPLRVLVPEVATIDVAAALLAALAALAIFRFRVGMGSTLAASVLLGMLLKLAV
ncbi:MAG: chromate efflux transporter [Deltaproteobacteria bacterium]|nr:chromate efflux transporter [Deltaproteobacteria bacterium]